MFFFLTLAGKEDMSQIKAFKEIHGAIVMVESNAEHFLEEAIDLKKALNTNLPTIVLFNKVTFLLFIY